MLRWPSITLILSIADCKEGSLGDIQSAKNSVFCLQKFANLRPIDLGMLMRILYFIKVLGQ